MKMKEALLEIAEKVQMSYPRLTLEQAEKLIMDSANSFSYWMNYEPFGIMDPNIRYWYCISVSEGKEFILTETKRILEDSDLPEEIIFRIFKNNLYIYFMKNEENDLNLEYYLLTLYGMTNDMKNRRKIHDFYTGEITG